MDLSLVAIAPDGERREWPLTEDEYTVGRAGSIAVEGDPRLSRVHFTIRKQNGKLQVERCPNTRNPLIYHGQEADRFELAPGDLFYAGETRFQAGFRNVPTEYTLVRQKGRARRLQDCLNAVLELLRRLRAEAGSRAPWRPAFGVIREILPEVHRVAFLEGQPGSFALLEQEGQGVNPSQELLARAWEQNSTVTFVWEIGGPRGGDWSPPSEGGLPDSNPSENTLAASFNWAVGSPIKGVEGRGYALFASGTGFLQRDDLEELAAIVDVVADLVGHHLIIEEAAEYSNLLSVFGHHVGTLFKTSGALKLWSECQPGDPFKEVLDQLLPIWGISQAISLHKKQGEQEWAELLTRWVHPKQARDPELPTHIRKALERLVAYVHGAEPPFLPWHPRPQAPGGFPGLPPLDDNPVLLDKTVALTIGLVEMLNNLRKYPEARGAGREDRRELAELDENERRVNVSCAAVGGTAYVEVEQPVVTSQDGSIPESRSLDRIRSLERRLLHGLVETGRPQLVGPTSVSHIVRVRQRWIYRYSRLVGEWRSLGQETAPLADR